MSNIEAEVPTDDGKQITIDDYREAKAAAAKAQRVAEIQGRELAMMKAGIPTGTRVGQAFVKEYDGDLNDPEKVRTAAIEWGLWKPEGADATSAPTPADQAQVDADREMLQQGGRAPDGSEPPPEHPGQVGLREFFDAKAAGFRAEDAAANVINRIVDAANKGDDRVLIQSPRQN